MIAITKPNGEKIELIPNQIDFDVEEEDEVWYSTRKRKFRIMNINYGNNKEFWFNFKENNFVDYSMHIQNQCKDRFGERIKVNDNFKEEFGLKEYGLFATIVIIIWVIYFTVKHYY